MLQFIRRSTGLWMFLGVVLCFALGSAAQLSTDLFSGLQWRNGRSVSWRAVSRPLPARVGEPGTFYVGLPQGGIWKTTSARHDVGSESSTRSPTSTVLARFRSRRRHPQNLVYAGTG